MSVRVRVCAYGRAFWRARVRACTCARVCVLIRAFSIEKRGKKGCVTRNRRIRKGTTLSKSDCKRVCEREINLLLFLRGCALLVFAASPLRALTILQHIALYYLRWIEQQTDSWRQWHVAAFPAHLPLHRPPHLHFQDHRHHRRPPIMYIVVGAKRRGRWVILLLFQCTNTNQDQLPIHISCQLSARVRNTAKMGMRLDNWDI